jgi:membrane-bound serine protease (ClpP class)
LLLPCLSYGKSEIPLIRIDSTVNPVIADFIREQFEDFEERKVAGVVLQIDTPGGLLESTRKIITEMLNAKFPVIVYVSPRGARAASAGFFILMASDIALMAPSTHTGAASPVSLGQQDSDKDATMKKKVMEDTLAYMRNLAKRHGRPVKWAVKAVSEGKSYTAEEAKKLKLIDKIIPSLGGVEKYLEGRSFRKHKQRLRFRQVEIKPVEIPWHKRLLIFLSNPNVVYILFILGIYGIIFEFFSPGIGFPGIFGFICLMMGFAGLSLIPVNYIGLALMLLGVILLILEINIISYGLLTIGGLFSLALGSFMFFESYPSSFSFVNGFLIGIAVVLGGFLMLALTKITRLRKKEAPFFLPLSKTGEVREDFEDREGMIWLEGEYWEARGTRNFKKGDKVLVTGKDGNLLEVEEKKE